MAWRKFYGEWALRVTKNAFGWSRGISFVVAIFAGVAAYFHVGRDFNGFLWAFSILVFGAMLLFGLFRVPYLMYEELERERDGLKTILRSTAEQKVDPSRLLSEEYESFARRLQVEWAAERDSNPDTEATAQEILARARQKLLDLRARSSVAERRPLCDAMDQIINKISGLQHLRMFIDGGKSWIKFWATGDEIVADVDKAAALFASQ